MAIFGGTSKSSGGQYSYKGDEAYSPKVSVPQKQEAKKSVKQSWWNKLVGGAKEVVKAQTLDNTKNSLKIIGKKASDIVVGGTKAVGEDITTAIMAPSYLKKQEEARKKAEEVDRSIIAAMKKTNDPAKKKKLAEILNIKSDAYNIERDLPAIKKSNVQILGDFAMMGTELLGGGALATKGAAAVTAKTAGTKAIIKQAAKTGAKYGAGSGVIQAAQEGDVSLKNVAKKVAVNTAGGAVLGAGVAGASAVAGKISQKLASKSLKPGQSSNLGQEVSQSSPKGTPKAKENASFDLNNYLLKQRQAQKSAEANLGTINKVKSFLGEIKTKLVDSNAPIEDILSKAEKKGKFNVLPSKDIRYQIDRVLRSDSIATQSLKDSGVDKVIRDVDDVDAFNQYLIAKQAKDVSKKGIETGRNLKEDELFINAVKDKYEPMAQEIYKHNRKMLDTLVDSGMISRELSDHLKKEYPNYVPLNRIFSETEQDLMRGMDKSRAVASVGMQKVVKKLKGSEREIENPLESILTKTSQVFEQAEKNKAARMLTSYKDLPGNPFGLREVAEKRPGMSTISVFENGQKKIFETIPEIEQAAKNMGQQHIGLLGQLFAIPTRLLKLGATGINLPFVVSNMAKDQVFSAINSNRVLSTSLANPINFVKALMTVAKKGQLYDDWVRSGASFTSFDLSRNAAKPTIESLRASRSVTGRIKYTVKHPLEFVRSVENIIGKSEELTRVQQFSGMRDRLLKEGRNIDDAIVLAANASRSNTANFARRGEWGTVLNSVIPYLNASIQGARQFRVSLVSRPAQTIFKLAGLVFTPVAYSTLYNLSDEKRREAYKDIPDYDKDGNLIILPPNPVKDENGNWNAIKIPLPPGLSNLGAIVRRQLEGIDKFDKDSFMRIAGDLLTAGTSMNPLDSQEMLSQLTPQGLKPGIESATNTNLFTGRKIVPEYMKDKDPGEQVFDNTSGTARLIGKKIGASPLKVENTIKTSGGGAGQQLLNISDQLLNKSGIIPKEQVGGESVVKAFVRRFSKAAGGEAERKQKEQLAEMQAKISERNNRIKEEVKNGDFTEFNKLSKDDQKAIKAAITKEKNAKKIDLNEELMKKKKRIEN